MFRVVAGGGLLLGLILAAAAAEATKPASGAKEKLAALQFLVGDWKGVGQLQRGSISGAWREKVGWAWQFGDKETALSAAFDEGKYFSKAQVSSADKPGEFLLRATPAGGGAEVLYLGQQDAEQKLIFTSEKAAEGAPARISMRIVANGARLLVLYEKRTSGNQFARLGEVGYTRVGSGFGQGSSGRECVITGGLGTIAVMFEGQTYYVCCTGCRDYFNDNPAKAIAEYKERKAAEKAEREKNQP
jgi:hypothetical protein